MDNQNTQTIRDQGSACKTLTFDQFFPSKFQPRNYFDEAAMAELTASVEQYGIITPILVRPIGSNQYELVAGERRYKAAKIVGQTEIPVVVWEMSDDEVMQYALMENLQREDFNPVEETDGILRLLELNLQTDRESVISLLNRMAKAKGGLADSGPPGRAANSRHRFQKTGRLSPESFRTHRHPLQKLPRDILDALHKGRIEYTKAKEIAKLEDEGECQALLEEVIAKSLTLRQVQKIVKEKKVSRKIKLKTEIEAISTTERLEAGIKKAHRQYLGTKN